MTNTSKPLFVARTPVAQLPEVTCTPENWAHVVDARTDGTPGHPELFGKEFAVKYVLERPSIVVIGDPRAYLVFVGMKQTNSKGHPLCVVASTKTAELVTAYHDKRYAAERISTNTNDVVWPVSGDS